MVIRYNTPLQLTSKVKGGTLIVGVLSTHAPAARLPKRAKVFGVIGSQLIALETVGEDGFLRVVTKSLPKYSMHVGIFAITVGWSLASKDTGNVETRGREDGRWRRRVCSNKVRKEASTDRCMSKVSLHCKEFVLGAIFGISKLHSTPLHILQLSLVCPIPVYVSNYPRVFEVNQGVVDKEMTSG